MILRAGPRRFSTAQRAVPHRRPSSSGVVEVGALPVASRMDISSARPQPRRRRWSGRQRPARARGLVNKPANFAGILCGRNSRLSSRVMRNTSTSVATPDPLAGLETVSVMQAARALTVTTDSIYRACHAGRIPFVRLGGGNGSIRLSGRRLSRSSPRRRRSGVGVCDLRPARCHDWCGVHPAPTTSVPGWPRPGVGGAPAIG
jgi:excisionase family DNA binding protein